MIFYGQESIVRPILNTLQGSLSESGDAGDAYRVKPVGNMSINTNMQYSSDNLIGYLYNITLEGSLSGAENGNSFSLNLDSIHKTRELLSFAGGALFFTDEEHNILFIARGGNLKSLNFNDNRGWATTVPYTAEIQFQEIDFFGNGNTICDTRIDSSSVSTGLVDVNKYKIKNFDDNWSFSFNDNIYTDIYSLDPESLSTANTSNLSFEVSYDLNAVGINYYTEDNKLIPAWEQAKLFCQERLIRQILNLVVSSNVQVLGIDPASSQCDASKSLSEIYGNANIGLLLNSNNGDANYGFFSVYNETVECTTSESDGSFSVSYKAIIKRGPDKHIHKFTKNLETSNNSRASNGYVKKYKIEGTIEGLVEGGLLYANNGVINLPSNGAFMIENPYSLGGNGNYTTNPKFDNAQNYFTDLTNGYSETDISDSAKEMFGITHNILLNGDNSACQNSSPPTTYPACSNFSVSKDFNNGSITWSAEYDGSISCGGNYSNITISINKGSPILATFLFPNGNVSTPNNPYAISTLIQDMSTRSNTTMDISIKGRDSKYCCQGDGTGLIYNLLSSSNNGIIYPSEVYDKLPKVPPDPNASAILTRETKDINIFTGEYTFNISYILCTPGCLITQGL